MLYLELLFCWCSSLSISSMMCGLRNCFLCFCGGFLDGALSISLHNLICLVANIFWIVFGIIYLWSNGIAYPLHLFVLVACFRCVLHLPLSFLFIMGLVAGCAPFTPRLLWCIQLCLPWCKVTWVHLLLLMSWRVLLCVRCWGLRRCFGVSLLHWIKRNVRLPGS